MKLYYCDPFDIPLPESHRFPLEKYTLLRKQLTGDGSVDPRDFHLAKAATRDDILRVHDAGYIRKLEQGNLSAKEMRRIGFPWSPQLVERAKRSAGATVQACRSALNDGLAASLSGGTHHAFKNHGEGYCILNDTVIAARTLQARTETWQILILDCDVHQGNGTAALVADDPNLLTVSIHGKNNFPYRKEKSDLDIELNDHTGDTEYLHALRSGLDRSLEMIEPELVIYLAGADPYHDDRFGRLALTKSGLADRDRLVLEQFAAKHIPVAITMAGGYARHIQDTVDIHVQTIQIALEVHRGHIANAL